MWIGHWGITESIVPQEPRSRLLAWLMRCTGEDNYRKAV
jgi:hypothetical protein